MANSVDPDQMLFAQVCLSECLGIIRFFFFFFFFFLGFCLNINNQYLRLILKGYILTIDLTNFKT